jgi:hypothetical protein
MFKLHFTTGNTIVKEILVMTFQNERTISEHRQFQADNNMHGKSEKLAMHQQTDSFNGENPIKKHPKTKNRQTPRFFLFLTCYEFWGVSILFICTF